MKHPAPFSKPIIDALDHLLTLYGNKQQFRTVVHILDPFAGTGRVHQLQHWSTKRVTHGVEIEHEWADMHPQTKWGNSLFLRKYFGKLKFSFICTSPTYGNRFSDKHDARDGSERRSYTHDLGHALNPGNTGGYPFHNPQYKALHIGVYTEMWHVLHDDGIVMLNVSNFIRHGEEVNAVMWHVHTMQSIGYVLLEAIPITTSRMRKGANHRARVEHEWILVFSKGWMPAGLVPICG